MSDPVSDIRRRHAAGDHYAMLGQAAIGELLAEIDRLERESANWSGLAATRNRNIVLIADERDRLRTALRWCLNDAYWLHLASCFESDEPKPAGVLETLEAERADILRLQSTRRTEP